MQDLVLDSLSIAVWAKDKNFRFENLKIKLGIGSKGKLIAIAIARGLTHV